MKNISICLVDDHRLFREGLAFLLSKCAFISTVYEAENGKVFIDNFMSKEPDIILMDIEMPVLDGIETTRKTLELYPNSKIIALSMYAHETYYSEMIDAGAKGFLLKNSSFENVQNAIQNVFEGNNYFSPEILDSLIKNLNKNKTPKTESEITEREIEILYNICKGYSNLEISNMLNISKRTVDKHRENLLLKTFSKNTAGLVIYAIKNGIFHI